MMKDVLENKLDEIGNELLKSKIGRKNIGLFGGKSGIAMFMYYLSVFSEDRKYSEFGENLLRECFEELNAGFKHHSFCSGMGGVFWVITHLAQEKLIELDYESAVSGADKFLHKMMMNDISRGMYDYLHEATGIALYFLHRPENPEVISYIGEFLAELKKQAIIEVDGTMSWRSVIYKEDGEVGVNLSLSHGIASIIAFLSIAIKKNIYMERCLYLLNGAVKYLLKTNLPEQSFSSTFPAVAGEDNQVNCRLAWCYGDPGISSALLLASEALESKLLEIKAVEVISKASDRKDLREASIFDAGICHGASGLALIFNNFYMKFKKEEFLVTSKYWLKKSLEMSVHKDGYAGYKTFKTIGDENWVKDYGLLEGITGIGFTIMSCLRPELSKWQRLLLLK